MSGGLVALLDDIATLAKATASSIDDVASSAVKVSAKAVGVVIDDTAVTPQFPQARAADYRENRQGLVDQQAGCHSAGRAAAHVVCTASPAFPPHCGRRLPVF